MNSKFNYKKYVTDANFLNNYNKYQQKYSSKLRESDKKIISIVSDLMTKFSDKNKLKILDIGCSTGNLLMHLKKKIPNVSLVGGDLALSSIELCRNNPNLQGIDFQIYDLMDLPENSFDIIIVNAVLYMLDTNEYNQSLFSLNKALKNNGHVIVFDFAHPYENQNLVIYEKSILHPEGLRLSFRPYKEIESLILNNYFSKIEFLPFNISISLPKPKFNEDVVSYTIKYDKQNKMLFRGVLYQPWCHFIISK